MWVEWTRVTDATAEPLTLAEAKLHLRVDQTDEDSLITDAIVGARQEAEVFLGRALMTQTWRLELSGWADVVWLPMAAPLQSVTSVQYYAADGPLTTLASTTYLVDTTSLPGRLLRAPGQVWPALASDRLMRVIVTYVAGYSLAADVPRPVRDGIAVLVGARYGRLTGREWAASVETAQALWAPHRVWWRPPVCAAA